jgi:hypothetical protein
MALAGNRSPHSSQKRSAGQAGAPQRGQATPAAAAMRTPQ